MNDTVSEDVKLDDDKLREILAGCEGVTPGPWEAGHHWIFVPPEDAANHPTMPLRSILRDVPQSELQPNADHIARLDPTTVASIITELLEARAYLASTKPPLAGDVEEVATLLLDMQQVADPSLRRRAALMLVSLASPPMPGRGEGFVLVTPEMLEWTAGALAAVHIASAIPAVRAEYDFDHADECLKQLWAALNLDSPRLAASRPKEDTQQ